MPRGSGFRRPELPRVRPVLVPITRPVRARMVSIETTARLSVPLPKEPPARSEPYRRLVAAMACMNCRINDNSQAAHPNVGKAKGMKADDRLCFPLCAVRFNAPGCHYLFDTHQLFPRSQRAKVEREWGEQTRAAILAAGAWPKNLPKWVEV